MRASPINTWNASLLKKYQLDRALIAFDGDTDIGQILGIFEEENSGRFSFPIFERPFHVNRRILASGLGGGQALFLHAFLHQYRQPGTELPSITERVLVGHDAERELDATWKLRLLLEPVPTRELLVERLREANEARRVSWEEHLEASAWWHSRPYETQICFETDSYQRYLTFRGKPDSPSEPPVATHEEIVSWLHHGGRLRTPLPVSPPRDAVCEYCLIDRKDGSWSIYGWNDGDGEGRHPPEEVIRYFDETMAYEFLLNAALQAVV